MALSGGIVLKEVVDLSYDRLLMMMRHVRNLQIISHIVTCICLGSLPVRGTNKHTSIAFNDVGINARPYSFIHSFRSLSYDESIASSKAMKCFHFQFPVSSRFLKVNQLCLRLLPCLPVTSIPPIFPSITCFRRQLAFRFLISGRIFLC